jgi:hypothetical protein
MKIIKSKIVEPGIFYIINPKHTSQWINGIAHFPFGQEDEMVCLINENDDPKSKVLKKQLKRLDKNAYRGK